MPKPWVWIAENTIEVIIDQICGAKLFLFQSSIMKCLNSLGMVSPPYVRLDSLNSVLTICDMCELCWVCQLFTEGVFLDVERLSWRLGGKLYHNKLLSCCTLERNFVGDIVVNERPIYRWSHGPRRCAVVWYSFLEQFVYFLWPLSLLLFWYIVNYGLIQSQVRQWCAGL